MKRISLMGTILLLLLGIMVTTHAQENNQDFTFQKGIDGQLSITDYLGQNDEMIIPSIIDGQSVTSIANEAFMGNGRIVSVIIPEGVNRIGVSAFQGAYNLETISFPNSLRMIEMSAFNSCNNLRSIIIPQGIETISESCFLRCMNLETVILPDSLKSISDYAFAITGIKQINFTSGLDSIGKHAFYGNKNLANVTFPNSLKRIDEYAFFVCDNLMSIVLPISLESMASGVFDKCPNLETVAIPMTVKKISDQSLYSGNLKPEKLKILGFSGSEAERFAKRMGVPFESQLMTKHIDLLINGDAVTNKLIAIDLLSGMNALSLEARSQPVSLWPGVIWKSSSQAVASVDDQGNVVGLTKGVSTISAMAADGGGAQSSLQLNVASLAKDITISGNGDLFSKGKLNLQANVMPASADNKNVDWSVSDPSIASISDKGTLTAYEVIQRKTFNITATAKDGSGVSGSLELTVYPLVDEIIIFNNGQAVENKETIFIDLASGDKSIQLIAKNSPADSIQKMTWKSSSNKVATISDDGLVTGLRNGKTKISATTSDGTKKTISFTVNVANLIKEISISGSVGLGAEQKQKLSAVVLPESASNKKLEWSSSDESVVRINKSSGEVTARKTDMIKNVTITASALDGSEVSAQFDLTVHPLATGVLLTRDGFVIENKAKIKIILTDSISVQLGTVVEPEAALQKINWKSSDERVVKVDENGLVTILKKGKATITATALDGSRKRNSCELIISD